MGTKVKSKKSNKGQRKVTKISKQSTQLSWPVILVAIAVLGGLVMGGWQYFINPSEAARNGAILTPAATTTKSATTNRSTEEQGFIDEASRLFHDEYNKCYVMSDTAAKCKCMSGVIAKLEALRARILAAGDKYQSIVSFWVDYYITKIKETMSGLGCDSNGNVSAPSTTSSVLSRWSRLFRMF